MAKKYIINEKRLILSAAVEFHRELAKDHKGTRGGGMWDIEDKKLYLFGFSSDFGRVDKAELIEALNNEISHRFDDYEIYFSREDWLAAAKLSNVKIREPKNKV